LNFDTLLFHGDGQRDVELLNLSRCNFHRFFLINRKPCRRRGNGVIAGRQSLEFINTLGISHGRGRFSVRSSCSDRRVGNDGSGGIGDPATQSARRSLGRHVGRENGEQKNNEEGTRAHWKYSYSHESRRYGVSPIAPATPPVDKFQGERMVPAWLGEAVRIGSTPLNRMIAVEGELALPSVATIIRASPFCKSASVTAGMRLSICWKSGGPPERCPCPFPGDGPSAFAALGVPAAAPPPGPPGAAPFRRMAMRC